MAVAYPTLPAHERLLVFIRESKYEGLLPRFYEPEQFPELKPLIDNWEGIRDEVFRYEKMFGSIQGLNTYSPPELSSDKGWSNLYFENFMWRIHKNRKHFPISCTVVDKIPNATYGAVSILSPGGEIKAHYGDTNGIIRCHLGLDVPASYPVCGIRVAGEERGWKNGKITMFTEAHLHNTWNHSRAKRYVFVVDIVPRFFKESRWKVCAKVLGAQTHNYFEGHIPLLKKIPDALLPLIHAVLTLAWRLYLPLQRKLRFL